MRICREKPLAFDNKYIYCSCIKPHMCNYFMVNYQSDSCCQLKILLVNIVENKPLHTTKVMSSVLICGFAVVIVILFQLRNVGRRSKGLPPGPPTLPLIGNLHLMPSKDPHHQFKRWAEEYG